MKLNHLYTSPASLSALLAGSGVLLSGLDFQLAGWLSNNQLKGDLGEIMTVAETFGHGLGVILVLVAIWTLNHEGRRQIPRLLAASLGAGMVANLVKMCVVRIRPRAFDLTSSNVWDSFGPPFPGWSSTPNMQSFPSAHSATAVGFAVALAACYPRGRWLFGVLATLTCFSRMHVGAHYLSDVLVGAGIGMAVGSFCVRFRVAKLSDEPLSVEVPEAREELKKAA